MMQAGKNRFTAEDIHSIYGPDVATVRRMMNRGDFGKVINFTKRHKVVTLEGLLEYEAKHTGFVSGKPEAKQRHAKTNKPAVGRI